MVIYQFEPDPDPHFQFFCEHGARNDRDTSEAFRKTPGAFR